MVIHFRVSYDAQTFMVQGAQAFMAQAETYQYTFIRESCLWTDRSVLRVLSGIGKTSVGI